MKKKLTILFALVFLVTATASMAEETGQDAEVALQAESASWSASIEDGEWLNASGANAEIYLPAGWTIAEDAETGFTATDAEAASTLTVELSELAIEEDGDAQSAFETCLLGLEEEYERVAMIGCEAAVTANEEEVIVRFVLDDQLVTMHFAPAGEGGIADSALTVAETLYLYPTDVQTPEAE